MQLFERLTVFRREVGDAALLELFVPALAPLRRDERRDGICDLGLIGGVLDELDERRDGESGLVQQRGAQAGCKAVVPKVAAAQRGARFVDRARQKHEAREPRARIAGRSPAQADRAHQLDASPDL